ncbi:MAG: extracellular solute-binding protein [Clostridia bacterium]|nr:extracellular solute-binding protein [Clostridia bacterium]
MKKIKKLVAFILSMLILTSLFAGCSKKEEKNGKLKVMIRSSVDFDKLTSAKNLSDKYPGGIEWIGTGSADQESLLFASGDFADVVLGNMLQDTDVSKYASNGVLIPLDDYINEDITPNLCKLFEKYPSAKAVSTYTDGHIYALPRFNGMKSDYLESVMFINKVWLDKLNLEVPTTTDELYNVLKAFKTKDPNGNGQADEVPMIFANGHSFSMPEALLSSWGVSTKHGEMEGFLTVKKGKVKFAPAMNEWKEMIKYYNKLYTEGLLDIEVFTQSFEQFQAKVSSQTSKIGVAWSKTNPFVNADEYIAIAPVSAPGYDIVWRIHPGALGIKNVFSITNKCKDIEGAMKWIDTFYTEEATLENWYGPVGEVFTVDNGMYKFNKPEEGKSLTQWSKEHTLTSVTIPGVFYEEELGTLVENNSIWTDPIENYKLYEKYLDSEPWPRPYYSEDAIKRISELRTDIINLVEKNKANWIVGNSDVDKEWDKYLKELKNIGLDEYVKLNQEAYDVFNKNMK